AVGQDRTVPRHERMKPSSFRDKVVTRPQIKMIRVAEDHLGAETGQIFRVHPFDAPSRADREKGGGLDLSMIGGNDPPPRRRAFGGMQYLEMGSGRDGALSAGTFSRGLNGFDLLHYIRSGAVIPRRSRAFFKTIWTAAIKTRRARVNGASSVTTRWLK